MSKSQQGNETKKKKGIGIKYLKQSLVFYGMKNYLFISLSIK